MITPRQANVMEHALAYPKRYRNHYYAMGKTPNDDTWRELVELGFASLMRHDGAYNVYFVTDLGIEALILYHDYKKERTA